MIDPFEDFCWRDIVDADTLDIYANYRRETFVGPRPAVLAIDLYNKAYAGGDRPVREINAAHPGSCGENAWRALEPTQKLFAAARAVGVPIIYSTRHADTDGVESTNRRVFNRSEEGNAIKQELSPQPGELVIYKERASVFFGTPLIAHLRRLRVESLIVCGESTSGCVRATTVDAYSFGFHSTVVEDCVFDRSMLSHKVNLFDLHHKYADVMRLDAVLAHLAQTQTRREAAE